MSDAPVDTLEREPDDAGSRRWRWIFYVPAVLAWLVLSAGGATDEGATGAENAGRIIGALVFPLAVALIVRLVYVKVILRSRRKPFWSPWIFVIAAVLGLLASIGRISERENEAQPAVLQQPR